jgi:hypothetical protein
MACCDGVCPVCSENIKTGMTKVHLMDCHKLTEAQSDAHIELKSVLSKPDSGVIFARLLTE